MSNTLAVIVFDPFVDQERGEGGGDLLAHYAAPLVIGDDAYIAVKTGSYLSCDPPGYQAPGCGLDSWNLQTWTVQYRSWIGSTLTLQNTLVSGWIRPPYEVVAGWDPVFQPAVSGDTLWVPDVGGTVLRADRRTLAATRVNPFGDLDPNRYTTGPLVVDVDGTLLYNVIELSATMPVLTDAKGFLVRVPQGTGTPVVVDYQRIVKGNDATSGCCGLQRPGFNSAPAIGPGGTIFVVSRGHFSNFDSSIVALNSDLATKWIFQTGPIVHSVPIVFVDDTASSVPVALPDGAVLYGGPSDDFPRGRLVMVTPNGRLLGTYDFGWDVTPAVWVHDNTYSIVTKDNYGREGPYYMTQLKRDLTIDWRFESTETRSCTTQPDGGIDCVSDHPGGFEWCVNAPAVTPDGTVYANSEDGWVYAIEQGGTLDQRRFLTRSLGAAYTPITIDSKGRVYSLNGGILTVVGK